MLLEDIKNNLKQFDKTHILYPNILEILCPQQVEAELWLTKKRALPHPK